MVDGRAHPLVVLVGPGQGSDSPMFIPIMESLRVTRLGPGRPKTRPDMVGADKASPRANREHCHHHRITCVIPVKKDQKTTRIHPRPSRQPRVFLRTYPTGRNVIKRALATYKQWQTLTTTQIGCAPLTEYDFPRCSPIRHAVNSGGSGMNDPPSSAAIHVLLDGDVEGRQVTDGLSNRARHRGGDAPPADTASPVSVRI